MIPRSRLDDRLLAALRMIDGKTFAGGADLGRGQWDAAVLVLSALANELATVEAMVSWAVDDGSSLAAADIAANWGRWVGTTVERWADLERPVSHVFRFRRAT